MGSTTLYVKGDRNVDGLKHRVRTSVIRLRSDQAEADSLVRLEATPLGGREE
jgi:hypothetical protein